MSLVFFWLDSRPHPSRVTLIPDYHHHIPHHSILKFYFVAEQERNTLPGPQCCFLYILLSIFCFCIWCPLYSLLLGESFLAFVFSCSWSLANSFLVWIFVCVQYRSRGNDGLPWLLSLRHSCMGQLWSKSAGHVFSIRMWQLLQHGASSSWQASGTRMWPSNVRSQRFWKQRV